MEYKAHKAHSITRIEAEKTHFPMQFVSLSLQWSKFFAFAHNQKKESRFSNVEWKSKKLIDTLFLKW